MPAGRPGIPTAYRRTVSRREVAFGLVAFATAFVAALLIFDYPQEGPVVATLSESHGLHAGDLLLLLGWLGTVGLAVAIGRKSGRNGD